jgi:endonuclease G
MKFKKLLIYSLLAFTIVSCSKKQDIPADTTDPGSGTVVVPPVVVPTATPYAITETFDAGAPIKGAYADGTVVLSTGTWDFNDALLGNLSTDIKNGAYSVRLRTGSITTNFDIAGLNKVIIKHSKYGADATSTWQLMMSKDRGVTFTQVGTDISETNTTLKTDSFAIASDSPVRLRIQKTGTTRINIDDITFKGTGDPGITVGIPDTPPADTSNTGSATTPRTVTFGADAPPASGDNSNLLFGNPSSASASVTTPNNYLIDQGYYVESYNSAKAEPNWVSWHLDASNSTNITSRLDNFAGYSGLPQGFYQVQSNSYSGSGFDRGHNCPSADRTSSTAANSATFLMTNMIPQAPNNNQQTWANLENYLRTLTDENYEVYIIMGSYGTGGTGSAGAANTINAGHVNVPSNVWKIAVVLPVGNGDIARVTSATRVIAVNTPNINTINSDWKQYITTIKAIETATGYTILSALPQSVHDALATKTDPGI